MDENEFYKRVEKDLKILVVDNSGVEEDDVLSKVKIGEIIPEIDHGFFSTTYYLYIRIHTGQIFTIIYTPYNIFGVPVIGKNINALILDELAHISPNTLFMIENKELNSVLGCIHNQNEEYYSFMAYAIKKLADILKNDSS